MNPADALPPVSIVVIGRNEGPRLQRCLASIRALDYPPDLIELIYVDSASTDDSVAVAERHAARVLRQPGPVATAAAGRNLGWRAARFDLVHFVDGDTEMDPGWLRKAVSALRRSDVYCVYGHCEEVAPRASVYNFCFHHDWYRAPGPVAAAGGIALFRRAVLEHVDGFDEQLVAGEEPEMCHRITAACGGIILVLDEPMVRHDIHMYRFSQYWRRCRRTGYGYAEVSRLHPDMHAWRRAVRRNLLHASAPVLAAVLALALRAWWPIAVWALLLAAAVTRNALRHRRRVGSLSGALLYSAHHYVSKLPMAVGQFQYWLRPGRGRAPRRCPSTC